MPLTQILALSRPHDRRIDRQAIPGDALLVVGQGVAILCMGCSNESSAAQGKGRQPGLSPDDVAISKRILC